MTITRTTIANVIAEAKRMWNDETFAHSLTVMNKNGKYSHTFSFEEFPTLEEDKISSISVDSKTETFVSGEFEIGEYGEVYVA